MSSEVSNLRNCRNKNFTGTLSLSYVHLVSAWLLFHRIQRLVSFRLSLVQGLGIGYLLSLRMVCLSKSCWVVVPLFNLHVVSSKPIAENNTNVHASNRETCKNNKVEFVVCRGEEKNQGHDSINHKPSSNG